MKQIDKHLTVEQIERLIGVQPTDNDTKTEASEEARHLAGCEICQRRVAMYEEAERELARLRECTPNAGTQECPSEQVLNEVGAGIRTPEETERVLKHACQCDRCGPLLRQAVEVFDSEEKTGESAMLASLQSNKNEWQANLSRRLAREGSLAKVFSEPRTKITFRLSSALRGRWAYLVAALVVLTAITALSLWRSRAAYANQLLAEAYTERRTLELRIPGAKYAPMRNERGAKASSMEKPASLLKAEALIVDSLQKKPNDPQWLEAKGRADLLDGNYESAIKSLQRALENQPDSPSLLTDLGSAYFLRAEMANRPIDYGAAIELLSKSLVKSPDDAVALFNRALACERMFLYTQAEEDWERYLRVDRQGPWASDARTRLQELRARMRERSQSSSAPLWTTVQVAGVENGDAGRLNSRIEDYLNIAVRQWLPEAFPVRDRKSATKEQAKASLDELAGTAQVEHGDTWLEDLLSATGSEKFPDALQALSAGALANDSGDYGTALRESSRAEKLFVSSRNSAGALRARLENAFALHFLRKSAECTRISERSEMQLKNHAYRWIEIQFRIERAICAGLTGYLGESQKLADSAMEEALKNRYVNLYLRALALSSDLSIEVGDRQNAWSKAASGLDEFWSGTYRSMAGYNLYTDLDTVADNMGDRFLQVAIWRQAIVLVDSDPDLILRAMAHRWLANAAFSADMPGLAEQEFREASLLFAAAPQSLAMQADRAEAEIWLTRLQIARGDWVGANNRMKTLEPILPAMPNNYVGIHYHEVKGELEFLQNRFSESETSLREAIRLAEIRLRSLSSEDDRLSWRRETSSTYRELVELKIRSSDTEGALELWEWYKAVPLRLVRGDSSQDSEESGVAARKVSQGLPAQRTSTVLSFSLLADGLGIWLYDDRGVKFHWEDVAPSKVIELARRFVLLCSNPDSDMVGVRQTGRALYGLLVSPLAQDLDPNRTLVIEMDERIGNIPMEALVDTEGRFLAERVNVVSSLGLYFQKILTRDSRISRDSYVTVVSVPAAGSMDFAPLPETREEAREVAKYFSHVRLLEGEAANSQAVRQALNESEVFHFAGHAATSGEKAGLVLLNSDKQTGWELFDVSSLNNREFPSLKLVVLSACNTAVGSNGEIEQADSLVQHFLLAGVPHVIATRWPVDSAFASTFMMHFYQELLSGQTISHAMRQAQLATRDSEQRMHPYYWSAFTAFGRE